MTLLETYAPQIAEFVGVCKWLADHQYATSSGGNLAWRLAENLILITPTRMNKGDITPNDVVFIDLKGKTIAGTRRPTGETPMYLRFFNQRPDIVSVVHCHPPCVCALAISKGQNWLMRPFFPETTIEVGPVPIVPYAEPITEKLADNFEPFIPKYNSFIMENHGLVSMTRGTIRETLMNLEILEMTAQSILLALQAGELKELDRQALRDLSNTMRTRELPLMGAPGVNPSLEALYFEQD